MREHEGAEESRAEQEEHAGRSLFWLFVLGEVQYR